LVDWDTLPEALLTSNELREVIVHAVETLNPNLRAVFLLRDIEELSTEETAQALGIQEGAVKVRLHRARLALREQLAGYFEERIP
jgi:RNA polymerase sigma-70 factor (ECF subfamily)